MTLPGELVYQPPEAPENLVVNGELAESSFSERIWTYEARIGPDTAAYADLGFNDDGKSVEIELFTVAESYRSKGYGSAIYQDLINRLTADYENLELIKSTTDEKAMVKIRSNLQPPHNWRKSYALVYDENNVVEVDEAELDTMMDCVDKGGWVRFALTKHKSPSQ